MAGRDKDWKQKVKSLMKKHHGQTKRKLDDINNADKPSELLSRALSTLEAIDIESDSLDSTVLDIVKQISSISWDFQQVIKRKSKNN